MKKIFFIVTVSFLSHFSLMSATWYEWFFKSSSDVSKNVCDVLNKQIDRDIEKIKADLAREQLKISAGNVEMNQRISNLMLTSQDLENKYTRLNSMLESNKDDLEAIKKALIDLEDESRKHIEKNATLAEMLKNQNNVTIIVGGALIAVGGIIIYQLATKKNVVNTDCIPDNYETKQKVLAQLRNSRDAYAQCRKNSALLPDQQESCEKLFLEFLESDKLFKEAYSSVQ